MNTRILQTQYVKITAIATAILLLAGCNPAPKEPVDSVEVKSQVQLANPASTYCVSLGGTVDIEKQAEGEVGYCSLPSGERIEEWTLYRKDHPQRTEAATTSVEHKPQVGLPNPATKNCIEQGGTVDLTTSICTLPSGEQIEQWQLYRRDTGAAQQ